MEAPAAVPVNRYAHAKVYRIISDLTNQVYVGSTCNPLSKRMAEHRSTYRAHLAGRYPRVTSFDILQHGDAKIFLLENVACESKEQLLARERHWIETTLNCVNRCIPGRTDAEYHEYQAKYRETNRGIINQRHDCPCGGKFTTTNKLVHLKTKKHQEWAKNEAVVPAAPAVIEA